MLLRSQRAVAAAAAAVGYRDGLGCLVENYHVKLLGTSLTGNIIVSQRRLGFLNPGPSAVQPARARRSAVVVDVGFNLLCPKT